MPLVTEVGLGAGRFVSDGDLARSDSDSFYDFGAI